VAGIGRLPGRARGECRSAGRNRPADSHLLGSRIRRRGPVRQHGRVAEVLLKLHKLTAPEDLHLPELAPFASAPQRIDASTWLSPPDWAFLTSVLAQTQAAYAGLEFAFAAGRHPRDANVGNVQVDYHGNQVVIDLDGFAVGPREWDLALTAIRPMRRSCGSFGRPSSERRPPDGMGLADAKIFLAVRRGTNRRDGRIGESSPKTRGWRLAG
jgi:hypothetical protein